MHPSSLVAVILSLFVPISVEIVQVQVVTVGLTQVGSTYASLVYNGGAVDTAVEELQRVYGDVFNLSHTYLANNKIQNCAELIGYSDELLAEWYYKRNKVADFTAFIAAACAEHVNVNRLAAMWNIFTMTSVGNGVMQGISPTWVTTAATSPDSCARLFVHVVNHFGWSSFYFVLDDAAYSSFSIYHASFVNFTTLYVPNSQKITTHINSTKSRNYTNVLLDFKSRSRVLVFFGHAAPLRDFMIQASQNNMTNGEFVYVAVPMFRFRTFGNFTWQFNNSQDEIAKKAYRSLLIITLDEKAYAAPTPEIIAEWSRRTLRRFNYTFYGDEVLLNKTISEDTTFNLSDGSAFAQLFYDKTFHLNYTDITFDKTGKRISPMVLQEMNSTTGVYEKVMFLEPKTGQLQILSTIDWGTVNNTVPLNEPVCGYTGDRGPCSSLTNLAMVTGIAIGVASFCAVMIPLITLVIKRRMVASDDDDRWWELDLELLKFVQANRKLVLFRISPEDPDSKVPVEYHDSSTGGFATYINEDVWAKLLMLSDAEKTANVLAAPGKNLQVLLKKFIHISHKNITTFRGLCLDSSEGRLHLLSSYCERGSLHDLFDSFLNMDVEHRLLLITDLLQGVRFIHTSPFHYHGKLTGWKCLVDGRFTLRITQLGFQAIEKAAMGKHLPLSDISQIYEKLYWTAPEILRGQANQSKITDIYSVGVIMFEIASVGKPYELRTDLPPNSIIELLRRGGSFPIRPDGGHMLDVLSFPLTLQKVIADSWSEQPESRPNIDKIIRIVKNSLNPNIQNVSHVERILTHLNNYADNLEDEVGLRTHALIVERHKCDDLLREMLPKTVVEQLRNGQMVDPEMFSNVTILFCNANGFDELTRKKTPLESTKMLNSLYSAFDPLLTQYDVYKVETIGDIYMVASGVPIRNGANHVNEICSLALTLRTAFTNIPEIAGSFFKAGVHTGPCAAGITGRINPRYCLFGDAVNTASRMGSYCVENHVHASSSTADLLRLFPGFDIIERGMIEVKGKGTQKTYWIEPDLNPKRSQTK